MNKLLKGGNWDYGVGAGIFGLDCSCLHVMGRELIPIYEVDKEGLLERQISIVCGRTERRRIIKRMKNKVKAVQESKERRCERRCERCGKLLWNGLEGPLCLECLTSKKAKKGK